jgi:hypothetical protein
MLYSRKGRKMPDDTMEVVVTGHLAGQLCQNVFHFSTNNIGGDPLFSYAKNLGEELMKTGGFLSKYVDCLPEDYTGSSVRVRTLLPTLGPTYYAGAASWVDGYIGTRSGDISSAQVSPLIIWIADTRETKTGRTFLPGVSEDDIDEMLLIVGLRTAIADFAAIYITGGTTSDLSWYGAIYRRDLSLNDLVVAAYLSPHIGTQRRRLVPV